MRKTNEGGASFALWALQRYPKAFLPIKTFDEKQATGPDVRGRMLANPERAELVTEKDLFTEREKESERRTATHGAQVPPTPAGTAPAASVPTVRPSKARSLTHQKPDAIKYVDDHGEIPNQDTWHGFCGTLRKPGQRSFEEGIDYPTFGQFRGWYTHN